MIKNWEDKDGNWHQEEAEPECGIDFCDACGDCLHCYADNLCYINDPHGHSWIVYYQEDDNLNDF